MSWSDDDFVEPQDVLNFQAARRAGLLLEALDKGGHLEESHRKALHALTRKVRISVQDLMDLASQLRPGDGVEETALRMMMAIRDRYEEIGEFSEYKDWPYNAALAESGNQTPASRP